MYQVEWDIQRKRYCRKTKKRREEREQEMKEEREKERERDEREKRAHPYELVSSSTKQLGKKKSIKCNVYYVICVHTQR